MTEKRFHRSGIGRHWPGIVLVVAMATPLVADEPPDLPAPIPATRPELKEALEALTTRQPRIPLPMPADGQGVPSYLPKSWGGGTFGILGQTTGRGVPDRQGGLPDPYADALFTEPCFWVVSRANNCHYCLGHQERKLRASGLDDDAIAALDADWARFDPRQQAVLEFARKLTLEPAQVGDADVAALRDHLSDDEIIELVFAIAQFNGINRWTSALGLPQESYRDDQGHSAFETPTSAQFQDAASIVTTQTRAPGDATLAPAEIAAAIEASRARAPRVPLPAPDDAARALAGAIGDRAPLAWERALSSLPGVGKAQVMVWNTIMTDDHLPPRLKAELAYVTAANNHAWYAAEMASQRLTRLGAAPTDFAVLVADDPQGAPGSAAAYRLARKLTVDPHLITDRDIADVRDHFTDSETAQIIHVICMANLFDRFTLALGLPPE